MIELEPSRGLDDARTALVRRVYGSFPSGVVAVSALRDDEPVGLAASSFTTVSLDPPLVSLCVQLTSTTWPLLADRRRLGISVLASSHDAACRQLAARRPDRFAGLAWSVTDGGAVLLHEASAWLECSIHNVVRAGDHDIVVLRVHAFEHHDGIEPLIFHGSGFRELARPEPLAS